MIQHHHKHAPLTHGQGKPTTMSIVADDNGHDGKLAFHEDIRLGANQKWEAAGIFAKPTKPLDVYSRDDRPSFTERISQ